MGDMGMYHMFGRGAHPLGGMFNRPPEMPWTSWLFYVSVCLIAPVLALLLTSREDFYVRYFLISTTFALLLVSFNTGAIALPMVVPRPVVKTTAVAPLATRPGTDSWS